jgi:hypothetical protein
VIRFPMPVALPPPGRYRVVVGPAWSPDGGAPRAVRPAVAELDAGATTILVVSRTGLPPAARLRVAFVAPAQGRTTG